ncbi:hypothetical protein ABRP32_12735 [Providencia manganoxydans]|uniref:hypothetical protein n=1 Tax=Providencia manganoxydans TaxID=2923283 RepID=UPI003AF40524
MKKISHFNEIVDDSRGLWLSGLFSAVVGWNRDNSFYENKDVFFSIIEELLNEKVIKFCSPDDPLGKVIPYWDTDNKVIVNFLKQHWPENANAEEDDELNFYFYEMPAVLWLDEKEKYIGS